VQLAYRMGGNSIPRDADQQHDKLPKAVSRQEMQAGDLIFFGRKRITHVALALDNHTYIHAEGDHYNRVVINSFDDQSPAYNASLATVVWAIKRVRSSIN
jgi:cell wall-associated NlpC family hydrolase